jgi:hypothetical protein
VINLLGENALSTFIPANSWQPLEGAELPTLYNAELKLYKLVGEKATHKRQPGYNCCKDSKWQGTSEDSGLPTISVCKASWRFCIRTEPLQPTETYLNQTRYAAICTDHTASDLRAWLCAITEAIKAHPDFQVAFKTRTARDYAGIIQCMRLGLAPRYFWDATHCPCRYLIGEPFVSPRHPHEAVINPVALANHVSSNVQHTLTQLETDVYDEQKHKTRQSVILVVLHAVEVHFNLHLSSNPVAHPHLAFNLKNFIDEWLPRLTHLPYGG